MNSPSRVVAFYMNAEQEPFDWQVPDLAMALCKVGSNAAARLFIQMDLGEANPSLPHKGACRFEADSSVMSLQDIPAASWIGSIRSGGITGADPLRAFLDSCQNRITTKPNTRQTVKYTLVLAGHGNQYGTSIFLQFFNYLLSQSDDDIITTTDKLLLSSSPMTGKRETLSSFVQKAHSFALEHKNFRDLFEELNTNLGLDNDFYRIAADPWLTVPALAQCITDMRNQGVEVDSVVYDSCVAASVEFSYELGNSIDFLVGSPIDMYINYPHEFWVQQLSEHPAITPGEIADNVLLAMANRSWTGITIYAKVDLRFNYIDQLKQHIAHFASCLINEMANNSIVRSSLLRERKKSRFNISNRDIANINTFAFHVKNSNDFSKQTQDAADQILNWHKSKDHYTFHAYGSYPGIETTGLTIFFPFQDIPSLNYQLPDYYQGNNRGKEGLKFASSCPEWGNFLIALNKKRS